MKVLITGITGFAGSHLADLLLAEQPEMEVVGIKRWRSRRENVEHLEGLVRMLECDIRDGSATREVIESERPDYIFSHVTRMALSKGMWRDLKVLWHLEKKFRQTGQPPAN